MPAADLAGGVDGLGLRLPCEMAWQMLHAVPELAGLYRDAWLSGWSWPASWAALGSTSSSLLPREREVTGVCEGHVGQ